jgi:hypothetical protein
MDESTPLTKKSKKRKRGPQKDAEPEDEDATSSSSETKTEPEPNNKVKGAYRRFMHPAFWACTIAYVFDTAIMVPTSALEFYDNGIQDTWKWLYLEGALWLLNLAALITVVVQAKCCSKTVKTLGTKEIPVYKIHHFRDYLTFSLVSTVALLILEMVMGFNYGMYKGKLAASSFPATSSSVINLDPALARGQWRTIHFIQMMAWSFITPFFVSVIYAETKPKYTHEYHTLEKNSVSSSLSGEEQEEEAEEDDDNTKGVRVPEHEIRAVDH